MNHVNHTMGFEPTSSPLGKSSAYCATYAPELLFPIARKYNRQAIGVPETLPFYGVDLWTAYELSWLNCKGKPQVAIAELIFPCQSEFIVESKSVKLYLNSYNQTAFHSSEEVKATLEKDLSLAIKEHVDVTLICPSQFHLQKISTESAFCIDDLDISTDTYTVNPLFLEVEKSEEIVEEKLCSHLLKSNCLVTNQPDWASVFIHYRGKKIRQEGLLKYIISLRNHNEFHEQCVERIYMDILRACQPESLTVYARYTRRGGLDINPFRTNWQEAPKNVRLARQ